MQDSLSSPSYFRDWFRTIERTWSQQMSAPAKAIVFMILDRTLGWGKEWERIPLRHFHDGITNKDGETIHPGTGLHRATVMRNLKALVEAGAILKKGENDYSLNYKWTPQPVLTKQQMLRKPKTDKKHGGGLRQSKTAKKLQEQGSMWEGEDQPEAQPDEPKHSPIRGAHKATSGGAQSDQGGRRERPLKKGKGKKGQSEKTLVSLRSRENETGEENPEFQVNLAQVEARHQKKTNARKSMKAIPNQTEVGRVYDDLIAASFPEETPTMTRKTDATILKQYAYRWCRAANAANGGAAGTKQRPFSEFVEFLEWCIGGWVNLRVNQFHWMDDPPLVPQARFIVGMADHLEKAYARRAQLDKLRGLTPRQAMIEKLKQDGVSAEAAEEEANKKYPLKRPVRRSTLNRAETQAAMRQDAARREESAADRKRRIDQLRKNTDTAKQTTKRGASPKFGSMEWTD